MSKKLFSAILFLFCIHASAQDDLLEMVEDKSKKPAHEPVFATFKTTRILNSQSIETVKGKTMDFRITHRFGNIGEASGGGPHQLYGIDAIADVRIAFEFGITDKLMAGVGRSSRSENIDAIIKYRFLEQTADNYIPLTLAFYHSAAFTPMAKAVLYQGTNVTAEKLTDRFTYTTQLLIARKFGNWVSLQLLPTYTHRNFIKRYINTSNGAEDENGIWSIGVGGRVRLTKSMAVLFDYFHVLSEYRTNNLTTPYYMPLAIGWEIETGGHVFQLNFTNASGILENDFIPNTTDNWLMGGFKFGFNISRVFNI